MSVGNVPTWADPMQPRHRPLSSSGSQHEALERELTFESFSSSHHETLMEQPVPSCALSAAGDGGIVDPAAASITSIPASGVFPSSAYREVDHAVDRSLLGSCFATLAFLLLAFIFFCPVFALLLPVVLIVAGIRAAICAIGASCAATRLSHADLRWLFTSTPILCVLRLERGLDLGRVRDLVNARVVSAEGKNGRRTYPRFTQKITACASGYMWTVDPAFRLDEHVMPATQALVGPAELEAYLNTLGHYPVDFERPLWDVYVAVGEYGETRDTILILRFHPAMTDGISLVRLFTAALSDEQSPLVMKARFGGRTLVLNAIRSLIILPIVFLQKWIFTRRDFNIYHPLTRRQPSAEMHFVNMAYPLAAVKRVKQVTRCSFNDLFVAVVTGALRAYQQVCGIDNPFDLLSLVPVDLTSKRASQQMRNNYVLVDLCLPGNTEGMIPRLWEVRLRMDELKSSADAVILRGLGWIFHTILPTRLAVNVLHYFCDKASCVLSNVQGPDHSLSIGTCEVKSVASWFPLMDHVLVSLVFLTYGNQLSVSLCADKSSIADPHVFLEAIFKQFDNLGYLLENRRVPGEQKSQRTAVVPAVKTADEPMQDDSSSEELGLDSWNILQDRHLSVRLSRVQMRLQNPSGVAPEELEALRSEFNRLLSELRRRKSVVDPGGQGADFDEVYEEGLLQERRSPSRRTSLAGLSAAATGARRRSLALTNAVRRPSSAVPTGTRSRSTSRVGLQHTTRALTPHATSTTRSESAGCMKSMEDWDGNKEFLSEEHIQVHNIPLVENRWNDV